MLSSPSLTMPDSTQTRPADYFSGLAQNVKEDTQTAMLHAFANDPEMAVKTILCEVASPEICKALKTEKISDNLDEVISTEEKKNFLNRIEETEITNQIYLYMKASLGDYDAEKSIENESVVMHDQRKIILPTIAATFLREAIEVNKHC